jgi:hypothetical protein
MSTGLTAEISVFSLSLGSSGGNILVNTIDSTKINTYNLKLIGSITGYSTITDFILFTVSILDTCLSTVINKVAVTTT